MTVVSLDVNNIRAEAEKEFKNEKYSELKEKVKKQLVKIDQAKRVVENLELELEVMLRNQ